MLPEAAGRGQHFQALFFSCANLAYNWVYTTLLLNWFTCRLQTIVKNLTNERASKLRHYPKKDVLTDLF